MGPTRENKKFFICPEESMNAAGTCRFGVPAAISSSGGRTWVLLGETFLPPISGPMCKWLAPFSALSGSDWLRLGLSINTGQGWTQ